MVYTTIAGEPVIFHLTSMEALRQVFYEANMSTLAAGGIIAAIMLPLGQVLLAPLQPVAPKKAGLGRPDKPTKKCLHCLAGRVLKELLVLNFGVFLKLVCRFRLLLKLLACEALQAGLAE